VRFAGGLLIAISVLLPFKSCAGVDFSGSISRYAEEIADSVKSNGNVNISSVTDIIETQSEKYIIAEAEKLGIFCQSKVLALASPDNVVSPYSVTLWCAGLRDEDKEKALTELIKEKLGIPEGRQKFIWGN
jgi:hypothetical protein